MKRLASFLMIGVLITSFTWAGATIPDTKENSKTEVLISAKMVNSVQFSQTNLFTMEKAVQPTSQFQVFCDTYDMQAEVKIHTNEDGQKLHLTLTSEDGDKKQSVSLFKEDAEMLARFIENSTPYLNNRNTVWQEKS